jgi:hypothetical protein
MTFSVHMLPAAHGDCLWVEYGLPGRTHRLLIDGGVATTYPTLRAKILSLPPTERHFELLVVTHVDADHIEGVVSMLADKSLEARFGDVWFNGLMHLSEGMPVDYGGVQGEYLSALIQRNKLPWNVARGGGALIVPGDGPLPVFTLPGGLTLTLLSPTLETARNMADVWDDVVREAGLDPANPVKTLEHLETRGKRLIYSFDGEAGPDVAALAAEPYQRDKSPANGSSIAFLAEYEGKRCLFAADAFGEVLAESVRRLLAARGEDVLLLDGLKLPHHGSRANVSKELLGLVRSRHVLVSTSGRRFHHPDEQAIARVIEARWGASLAFNYRSEDNEMWDDAALMKEYGFSARYPDAAEGGITLDFG